MDQGEGSPAHTLPVSSRIDLSVAAGSAALAWTIAVVGALVGFFAAVVLTERLFGLGTLAVLPALGCLYLASWWRARRMVAAMRQLVRPAAAAGLRARVRSGSSIGVVWAGANTELVLGDGWVRLGDRAWPAASVTLGREPSFWSGRPIELLTPTGAVGFSLVPKGDVGMYAATLVDRRARPLIARALEVQRQAGPSPAGWYPDPQDPTAWRWWDGAAWSDRAE